MKEEITRNTARQWSGRSNGPYGGREQRQLSVFFIGSAPVTNLPSLTVYPTLSNTPSLRDRPNVQPSISLLNRTAWAETSTRLHRTRKPAFAIKVIDDQLPKAFDLIADMLVDPRFDDADLKSEQRVIIEEMKMLEDSPEEYLSEIFSEAFFPDHPLGMSIAGTPKTVKSFNSEVTRNYHAQTFDPSNLVIAAAGNITHDEVVKLATLSVSPGFRRQNSSIPRLASDVQITVPNLAAPIVIKQNSNLEQAHMIIATPFVSATDERRYAADLLANIIGGGTSSRLWQKVREERGLAYSVGASVAMYRDCGLFSIFAGTSPDQVGEVVELAIAEMKNVVATGVTTDELELAKQQTVSSILLSLEDSASRAASLAQAEMLHGRQISVEESLAKTEAVTIEQIQTVANQFFRTEMVAFAALGDLKGLKMDRAKLTI